MAEEPENLVLHYLRRFDERLERMEFDVHDIKVRLTHVEENQSIVHRRLDRIDDRLDRIEKRLELNDHPYGGVRE